VIAYIFTNCAAETGGVKQLICFRDVMVVTVPGAGQYSYSGRAGQHGFDLQQRKNFLFSTGSRRVLGAHPTSYPMGTGGKQPGSADNSAAWSHT
jgi:hypothetical protein